MHRKKYPKALNHITYSIHNHETVYCQCFGNKQSSSFGYEFQPSFNDDDDQSQNSYLNSIYHKPNKSIISNISSKSQYFKKRIPLSNKIPLRKTIQNKLERFYDDNSSQISKERRTDNIHDHKAHQKRNSVYMFKENNHMQKNRGNADTRARMVSVLSKNQSISNHEIKASSRKLTSLKYSDNIDEQLDDYEDISLPKRVKDQFINSYDQLQPQIEEKRAHFINQPVAEPNSPAIQRKNKAQIKGISSKMHRPSNTEDLTLLKSRKIPKKLDDLVKKKHLSYRTSQFSLADDGSQVTRIVLPISRNFKLIDQEYDEYI